MPAQVQWIDDIQRAEVVGLAPHHLLTPDAQGERRQQEVDEGLAHFHFGLTGMAQIVLECVIEGATDVVDGIVDTATDDGQRRLFEPAGIEAPERRAVSQKVILALDLRRVPLHHELGGFEARFTQDVLQVDKAFDLDVVGDIDDRLRRGNRQLG